MPKIMDLYGDVTIKTDKAVKNINKIKTSSKQAGDALTKNMSSPKIGDAFNKIKGKALAVVGAILAIVGAAKKMLDAFTAKENAINHLTNALGKYSSALVLQAIALQKVTTYSDNDIVTMQALIAEMGFTEQQILQMTPGILDFATAFKDVGLGTAEAAKLLAKYIKTGQDGFSRYGIVVKKAKTESERFVIAMDMLAEKEGRASEEAETMTGKMAQIANRFDDILASLAPALLPALEQVSVLYIISKVSL